MADRPRVGPADPATRRRLIEEQMRKNKAGDNAYKRSPAPRKGDSTLGTPVIEGQRRANAIGSVVDAAAKGGDERQSEYRRR